MPDQSSSAENRPAEISSSERRTTEASPYAPERALPPVQPPTAGFVFQLFVIPAIIVGIIAVVSLAFSWLAHMGGTPETLVKDLERGGPHSWQTAYNLARELQKPGNAALRRDEVLAGKLAKMLERQLDVPLSTYADADGASRFEPNLRKSTVQLRNFLCRTLGEFETPVVLPVLIRAATAEEYVAQSPDDFGDEQVRLSAIEAIAVLAGRIGAERIPDLEAVNGAIHQAASERSDTEESDDHRPSLRSAAAFALGVLGGDANLNRLESLCDDAAPNVRYNAATGLARHGDIRCQDVLLDMLSIELQETPNESPESYAEVWKQHTIVSNGLRSVEQLAHVNPSADLAALRQAVERLLRSAVSGQILSEARTTLDRLDQRKETSATNG